MRRFSQRSSLVTLSEINITPLLDLAFVLLIIFVITTPLLEQSISLKLPKGGQPDPKIEQSATSARSRSPRRARTGWTRCPCRWPQLEASWSRISARTRTWSSISAPTGRARWSISRP